MREFLQKNKSKKPEEDEEGEDVLIDPTYYHTIMFISLSITVFCFNGVLRPIIPICYFKKKGLMNPIINPITK